MADDLTRYLVTGSLTATDIAGRAVEVEATSPEEAAREGLERLVAEWADDLTCQNCEKSYIEAVFVFEVALAHPFVIEWEIRAVPGNAVVSGDSNDQEQGR